MAPVVNVPGGSVSPLVFSGHLEDDGDPHAGRNNNPLEWLNLLPELN